MAADLLRDLFVRLGVRVDPKSAKNLDDFNNKVEAARRRMIEQVQEAAEVTAGMAIRIGVGLAGAAIAGATALGGLAIATGQHATEVERQARALNLSREEYQKVLYLFESLGANSGDLADTFLQINAATQAALGGGKSMIEAFALVGLEAKNLKGLNPSQIFDQLAIAVSGAADKGKAMAAVSTLLGEESGRKLGPALMGGVDAIRAMKNEASDLGFVMDDKALAASASLATQWRRLTAIGRGLRNELGAALAPVVEKMVRGLTEWVRSNRELISQQITTWVERLRASIELLNAMVQAVGGWDVVFAGVASGGGLLLLIANLSRILETLGAIRTSFTFLKAAMGTASVAIGAPLLPVLLILGAFVQVLLMAGLAIEDVLTHFRGGDSVFGRTLDRITSLVPAFGDLRALLWAISQFMASGASNVWLLVRAFVSGLAPALGLLDGLLDPLLQKFRQLYGWFLGMGEWVAGPMRDATAWLEGQQYVADNNARGVAARLQTGTASAVQGQVDWARGNVDQSRNVSMSQSVNFGAGFGGSTGEISAALGSEMRKAAVAVTGGIQ
jgi:hypothetical protein